MTKRWAWLDYLSNEQKAAVDHEDRSIRWLLERGYQTRTRRMKLANVVDVQRARLAAKAHAQWLEERLMLARARRIKIVNVGIQRAKLAAKAQAQGRERRPYGHFRQDAHDG